MPWTDATEETLEMRFALTVQPKGSGHEEHFSSDRCRATEKSVVKAILRSDGLTE